MYRLRVRTKIILVGDPGVGKSYVFLKLSLLARFTRNVFDSQPRKTYGISVEMYSMPIDGNVLKTWIYDIAGRTDTYDARPATNIACAVGALLVYDISNRRTFEHMQTWLKEARDHADSDAVIMLVGTKTDLVDKHRVSTREGEAFAAGNGLRFMETSAADATNVENTFHMLFTDVYQAISKPTFKTRRIKHFERHSRILVVGDSSVGKTFCRSASGVLLVYDVSNRNTFQNIPKWLEEVRKSAQPGTLIMLVGNKTDLHHRRAVTMDEGQAFSMDNGLLFMETSALDRVNVESTFLMLLTAIHPATSNVPRQPTIESVNEPVRTFILHEPKTRTKEDNAYQIEIQGRKGNATSILTSQPHQDHFDYIIKVALAGANGVGKTIVASRFVKNEFTTEARPTSSANVMTRTINIEDAAVKADVWDTDRCFQDTHGVLLVYDISTTNFGFLEVERELEQLRTYIQPDTIIVLVGNKSDLVNERVVPADRAQDFAEKNGLLFAEASALNGSNVESIFRKLLIDIYHVFLAKEVMGIDHSPVSIPNTSHTKTPGRGIADNCEGSVEASAAQPSKEAASIGRVRSAGSSILLSMRSCFSSRPKA
ncbi:hypothetical protein IEO21_09865 [Rhodonia placenta]|uniref:Uncharacterized protein n=1 Tax=Rhodonia placenta TaxID=104341 RepID=A0A8H7NTL5_9APHY|nr:hypothetical protein IEO21_09865 [Postia placenta]